MPPILIIRCITSNSFSCNFYIICYNSIVPKNNRKKGK